MDSSMFPDVPDLDDETFGPGAVQALNEDKLKDLNTLYISEITSALQYNPNSLGALKTQYDEDYFNIFQNDNSSYEEKHDRFNELILTAKRQNNVFNRGGIYRKKNKRSNRKLTKKYKRSNRKRSNRKRSNRKRSNSKRTNIN
jgi:hypothetical protein